MPNIQFNYLYRDGGNYKNWGSVVFVNPDNYSLAEVEAMIKPGLIDGEFFYAEEWGLPDLRWDIGIDDPTWHEFAGLAVTDEASGTSPLNLNLIVRKAFAEARAKAGKGQNLEEKQGRRLP